MRRIAALATAGVVLLLLVLAQLMLPGIAAQRLRDRLARSGQVLQVKVDAFPAIELLWHQADHVVVRLARYRSSSGQLGSQLAQTGDVGTLEASVGELDTGLLTLRNVALRKRGNDLSGTATVTQADLRSALPILDGVQPVSSGNGALTLRGTATLLGVTATVDATVHAQNGQLVVQPNIPFGGLATITLFSDPHVVVQGVSASSVPGGFSLSGQATLK
jgi:hypothetical protein